MKRERRGRERGFTLVEVLVATSVALVLLAGLAGLFTALSRDRASTLASHASLLSAIRTFTVLGRDARSACAVRITPDAKGNAATLEFLDWGNGGYRPFATYRWEREGGRLLRNGRMVARRLAAFQVRQFPQPAGVVVEVRLKGEDGEEAVTRFALRERR